MVKGNPPKSAANEFALGILSSSLLMLSYGALRRTYAILLRRDGTLQMNWQRHETEEVLAFRPAKKFCDAVQTYEMKMRLNNIADNSKEDLKVKLETVHL